MTIQDARQRAGLGVSVLLVVAAGAAAAAQEPKPVPKNSMRVNVPGCSRGYLFLAGRPPEDAPGGSAVPEGTRLRMNGPKKLMAEIKGHEGQRIEITGLVRQGQVREGMPIGGGARISGGPPVAGGGGFGIGIGGAPTPIMIDVEGWRALPGSCDVR